MPKYDFQILKKAILNNTVEVLPSDPAQLDEEIQLLVNTANQSGELIRHYIGFEISGQIHIGTGISAAMKIKDLTLAGVECVIYLADYHTFLNGKLDGKIETMRRVAREYFGPVMLQCCQVVGCDMSLVKLVFAEELYQEKRNGETFWMYDIVVGKELTLSRVLKSVSITGKEAGESVSFGVLRYPVMQVADPIFMGVQLVHAGMDQRKCHVLMREVGPKLEDKFAFKISNQAVKPIAIHHSLLLGLEPPKKSKNGDEESWEASKMSKSKPDSSVWVHDSIEELERKLRQAYCPMPKPAEQSLEEIQLQQKWNPLLDWAKNMIYPSQKQLQVSRSEKFGGDKVYVAYKDLEADFFAGNLHPLDLKASVATCLADWFLPIREWVQAHPEGLELVKQARK